MHYPHFRGMFESLSFQGPAGQLLPVGQVLLGQLQGELGRLQPGLLQLRVVVTLTGAKLPQLPAQTLNEVLARLQVLLQGSRILQSRLTLLLHSNMKDTEKPQRRWNMSQTKVYTTNNHYGTKANTSDNKSSCKQLCWWCWLLIIYLQCNLITGKALCFITYQLVIYR